MRNGIGVSSILRCAYITIKLMRQALPLPALLITVKYVSYITTAT